MWREESGCSDECQAMVKSDSGLGQDEGSGDGEVRVKSCLEGTGLLTDGK